MNFTSPKAPPVYLNDTQVTHLLELLDHLPSDQIDFRTAITMLLFTGLRINELLGLNWSDVDLKTGIISVKRTTKYIANRGIIDDKVKSSSSRRSFKAPSALLPLLQRYKVWQTQQQQLIGDRWMSSDRIFTTRNGSPMSPNTLTARFRHWIGTTDLPRVSLHSLRQTNAFLLSASGIETWIISKRLGISASRTVADIYLYPTRSEDATAAEAVSVFKL